MTLIFESPCRTAFLGNFRPLKNFREYFMALKSSGKIFRPLKKPSDRVSGLKNEQPLTWNIYGTSHTEFKWEGKPPEKSSCAVNTP